jgi:hypothetical protein
MAVTIQAVLTGRAPLTIVVSDIESVKDGVLAMLIFLALRGDT